MHTVQTHWQSDIGWSTALPQRLDSPQTLVLAFGPRALMDAPQAAPTSAPRLALHSAADSHAAGARLAAQLLAPAAGQPLRAVFLLCDGLQVNGTALVHGLGAALPAGVSVSGGLAGDGSLFQHTWVLDNTLMGCTSADPTPADGTPVDGQPALALYKPLYKHYLGELAAQLPGSALRYPLSLRPAQGGGRTVVRTILGIDEATQSMTFAGDMPTVAVARLMRTQVDRLLASADEAAGQALAGMTGAAAAPPGPVLAVSVSCVGRRLVMGERTDEELEAVVNRLPAGSVQAGFYSYGEIAPAEGGAASDLHNQTMTLTVFAEA